MTAEVHFLLIYGIIDCKPRYCEYTRTVWICSDEEGEY